MDNDDKKYIPSLRFPEFLNDGEWESMKIGDAIITITPPKKLVSSEYKEKGKYTSFSKRKRENESRTRISK